MQEIELHIKALDILNIFNHIYMNGNFLLTQIKAKLIFRD